MFLYCALAILMTPALWSSCNVWAGLPEYVTIFERPTYWGTASWDEGHANLLFQNGPDQYHCCFTQNLRSSVRVLELSVCKIAENVIEIKRSPRVFTDNREPECTINLELVEQEQLNKSCLNIQFLETQDNMCWTVPIGVYDGAGLKMSLRVLMRTLSVFVGDMCVLNVLPFASLSSRGRMECFGFPAKLTDHHTQWSQLLNITKKYARGIPSALEFFMRYRKGYDVHLIESEKQLRFDNIVYNVARDFLALRGDDCLKSLFRTAKQKDMFVRNIFVRPHSSHAPGFEVLSSCMENVKIVPGYGVLNTDGTPFDIMRITYGDRNEPEGVWKKQDLLCELRQVGEGVEMQLKALMEGETLLLGCFSFESSMLNRQAQLELYLRDEVPHLTYPIAQNLSLDIRFGQIFKDGVFYICAAHKPSERIVFFGGRDGLVWRQQFMGVPEVCLDEQRAAPLPRMLKMLDSKQALCAVRMQRDAVNQLLFDYNIMRVEGVYNMSISARCLSYVGEARHEINVQLGPKEIESDPLEFEQRGHMLFVKLSPASRMLIFANHVAQEMHVSLMVQSYVKSLGCFAFMQGGVVQKPSFPDPTFGAEVGVLSSEMSYIFGEKVWGVCSTNIFCNAQVNRLYNIQFFNENGMPTMCWERKDAVAQETVNCYMRLVNDQMSSILCYYACCKEKNGSCCFQAGAIVADLMRRSVCVCKPTAAQYDVMPNFTDLQPEHVRAWPASTLFPQLILTHFPKISYAPDGARAYCDVSCGRKIYIAPIRHKERNESLKTLWATLEMPGCEDAETVVDCIEDGSS